MESTLINVWIFSLVLVAGTDGLAESVQRTVQLDEVTPQGILHLSATSTGGSDNSCNFWIDVQYIDEMKPNPAGISVDALGMELLDGAYILFMHEWDIPINESSHRDPKPKRYEWRNSVSFHPNKVKAAIMLESPQVCVGLIGNWTRSRADLLLTLSYDSIKPCPNGTILCECHQHDVDSSEESSHRNRCIPKDLVCNGISNCGLDCDYDESKDMGCTVQSYLEESCIWTKFEYLAMMVMTGLLLLLIPVLLVVTFMYHRRPSLLMNGFPSHFDGNNNRTSSLGQYPHIISTAPVNLDPPPRYEDLPDEVKLPNPSTVGAPSIL